MTLTVIAEETPRRPAVRPKEHATKFIVECLERATAERESASVTEIAHQYHRWCIGKGDQPIPAAEFGIILGELFDAAGVPIEKRSGQLIALGVALKEGGRALVGQDMGATAITRSGRGPLDHATMRCPS